MEMTFRYRFEAGHRFTGGSSPRCQTPHGHTWWIEVTFGRKDGDLDAAGMLAEFGTAKSWLRTWVDGTLDHSFFHHWRDPILPALRDFIPNFRGLPFPEDPTTEWITYLISRKVRAHLRGDGVAPNQAAPPGDGADEFKGLLELRKVRVEETPTNSMVWDAHSSRTLDQLLAARLKSVRGWWDQQDPYNRYIEPVKPQIHV